MKRILSITLTLAMFAAAKPPDEVLGHWAGEGSVIHVTRNGDHLSARVIALSDPFYTAEEDVGTAGEVRRDHQNPDESLRSRTVQGLELLSNYRLDSGKWEGKIYDPESGKTYSSNMKVEDGVLMMRGYVGVRWLGRTAKFGPLDACELHAKKMLQDSGVSGHCEL